MGYDVHIPGFDNGPLPRAPAHLHIGGQVQSHRGAGIGSDAQAGSVHTGRALHAGLGGLGIDVHGVEAADYLRPGSHFGADIAVNIRVQRGITHGHKAAGAYLGYGDYGVLAAAGGQDIHVSVIGGDAAAVADSDLNGTAEHALRRQGRAAYKAAAVSIGLGAHVSLGGGLDDRRLEGIQHTRKVDGIAGIYGVAAVGDVGIESDAYAAAAYAAFCRGGVLREDVYAAAGGYELRIVQHVHLGGIPGGGGQGLGIHVAYDTHAEAPYDLRRGLAGIIGSQLDISLRGNGAALHLYGDFLGIGAALAHRGGSGAAGAGDKASASAGIGAGVGRGIAYGLHYHVSRGLKGQVLYPCRHIVAGAAVGFKHAHAGHYAHGGAAVGPGLGLCEGLAQHIECCRGKGRSLPGAPDIGLVGAAALGIRLVHGHAQKIHADSRAAAGHSVCRLGAAVIYQGLDAHPAGDGHLSAYLRKGFLLSAEYGLHLIHGNPDAADVYLSVPALGLGQKLHGPGQYINGAVDQHVAAGSEIGLGDGIRPGIRTVHSRFRKAHGHAAGRAGICLGLGTVFVGDIYRARRHIAGVHEGVELAFRLGVALQDGDSHHVHAHVGEYHVAQGSAVGRELGAQLQGRLYIALGAYMGRSQGGHLRLCGGGVSADYAYIGGGIVGIQVVAAYLSICAGDIAAVPIHIEAGIHIDAAALGADGNVAQGLGCILGVAYICLVLCADYGLDHIHRNFHRAQAHRRGSYKGLGLGIAQSFHQDVPGGIHLAAAADVAEGHGARIGIGHVGVYLHCAYTQTGLSGQGVCQGVVLISHAQALDIDLAAAASFHIGAEVAVGSGVDYVHAHGQAVEVHILFLNTGLGIAPALGQDAGRLAHIHRHVFHIGVVPAVVPGLGHIGLHGDKAHTDSAGGLIAVAQSGGGAGICSIVQLGLHIYGGVAHVHALDICLIGGVQVGQEDIGYDLGPRDADYGSDIVGVGQGRAPAEDLYGIGLQLAAAAAYGCRAYAVGIGYGQVHLDAACRDLCAAGAGRHHRLGIGGIVGADVHVPGLGAASLGQVHLSYKLALRIGQVNHDCGHDGRQILVQALGEHICSALALYAEAAALEHQGLRSYLRHGDRPAVGYGGIGSDAYGCAVTADEPGKGRRLPAVAVQFALFDVARSGHIGGVHIVHIVQVLVQGGHGIQRGRGDVAALDLSLLPAAEQGYRRRAKHADGSHAAAPDLGVGCGPAVGAYLQRPGEIQDIAGCVVAAQYPGDVSGIVVRYGGVEAHPAGSGAAGNCQGLGLRAVEPVLTAGVHGDAPGVYRRVGDIQLHYIGGVQQNVAGGHAHAHGSAGQLGQIGSAGGVHIAVHDYISGLGDVHAVDACIGIAAVEHQKHLAAQGNGSAAHVGGIALCRGIYVVIDADVVCLDIALVTVICRRCSGNCAYVGADCGRELDESYGSSHCHCPAGCAYGKHVGIGIDGGLEADIGGRLIVLDYAHALGDEGLRQALIEHYAHACIYCPCPGGKACRRRSCGVPGKGFQRDAAYILDAAAAFNGGLGMSLIDHGGCACADAHHGSAQGQGGRHDVLILAGSLNVQLLCLFHAAAQGRDGLGAQTDYRHGHAHPRSAGHSGAEGQGMYGQVADFKALALVIEVVVYQLVALAQVAAGEERRAGKGLNVYIPLCAEQGTRAGDRFHIAVEYGHSHAHAYARHSGCAHRGGYQAGVEKVLSFHADAGCAGDTGIIPDEGPGGIGGLLLVKADIRRLAPVAAVGAHFGDLQVRAGLAGTDLSVSVLIYIVLLIDVFAEILVVAVIHGDEHGPAGIHSGLIVVSIVVQRISVAVGLLLRSAHADIAVAVAAAGDVLVYLVGKALIDLRHSVGSLVLHAFLIAAAVDEGLGIKVCIKGLGGIVVQLAAYHGGHEHGSYRGGAAAGDGGRIAADIPGAQGIYKEVFCRGDNIVVIAYSGADAVFGYGGYGSDAYGHGAGDAEGSCRTYEPVIVLGVYGDGCGLYAGLAAARIVQDFGSGDELGDDKVHGAGDCGGAAAGYAGSVCGDELAGIGQEIELALGVHGAAGEEQGLGGAGEVGHYRHAAHGHGAGGTQAHGYIIEGNVAVGGDVHIAAAADPAAQVGLDQILKEQHVAADGSAHRTAGDAQSGGQEVQGILAVSLDGDALFCADYLVAAVQNGADPLFKGYGDCRRPYGGGAGAFGR